MGHNLVTSGVEVRLDLEPELPPVLGDARAINQVFLNLLKNAAEAFEGHRGVIDVRAFRQEGWILLEIQDDGPGVAPEIAARLFEPFFTTKEAGRGSGLGLSITQRIVDEHGGRIEFVRPEQGGSCFRIRLPAAGARSGPPGRLEEEPAGGPTGAA
jgi:signal transduction histidine kinase